MPFHQATEWGDFVRSDNLLLLAMAGQRFGCRPSKMVAIRDPATALDFDLAAAARLIIAERGAVSEPEVRPSSDLYW